MVRIKNRDNLFGDGQSILVEMWGEQLHFNGKIYIY